LILTDCALNENFESNKFFLSDEDALLLDNEDVPPCPEFEEEDLVLMDFE